MSLYGAVGETVRQGKELIAGNGAVDSAGVLEITTPFAIIDAAVASAVDADDTAFVTVAISDNVVTFTAVDDAGAAEPGATVHYIIVGRRR